MTARLPAPFRAIDKIRQRRAAAVQRGVLLGLDAIPGVVLARLVDHGTPGVTMPPGTVVCEVWGGKAFAVLEQVRAHSPRGLLVVVVHHEDVGPLQRVTAWWRWTLHRVRRALRRGQVR